MSLNEVAYIHQQIAFVPSFLGIESYGVSLTSLEQVFIKLAKESETEDANTGHKSIYSRARAAFKRFAKSPEFPSLNFLQRRRQLEETNSFNEAEEGKMLHLESLKGVAGLRDIDNESGRTTVMETITPRNENMMKINIASAVLIGETKGLNPTTSSLTDYTANTDASSDKTTDPSIRCPTCPPVKRLYTKGSALKESTGDSKMPAQYDNEPSSPGKSSCWSNDGSLHSCDSNDQNKANSNRLPESNTFRNMDTIDCVEYDGKHQVCGQ